MRRRVIVVGRVGLSVGRSFCLSSFGRPFGRSVGRVSRSVGRSVGFCGFLCTHVFSRTVAAVDTKRGYVGMCNGRSAQQESGTS